MRACREMVTKPSAQTDESQTRTALLSLINLISFELILIDVEKG